MDRTDIGAGGLAASLALVAVAIVISRRERLRLERDMVIAIVRSLAQMLVVASALELIVKPSTPLIWSWLWVAAIVLFAAVTTAHRAPQLPGVFWVGLGSLTV